MKYTTLAQIEREMRQVGLAEGEPMPFPGKHSPVRVAWHALIVERQHERLGGGMEPEHPGERVLSYIGKPSRYRALEAHQFRTRLPRNWRIYDWWEVEFDRSGILAINTPGIGMRVTSAYMAYHPQMENGAGVVQSYTKPIFLKRIGKVPTYSYQKVLSQAQVQRYYDWWEQTFNKKLKKPKAAKPLDLGPIMEPPIPEPPREPARFPRNDIMVFQNAEGERDVFHIIEVPGMGNVMNEPQWAMDEGAIEEDRRRLNAGRTGLMFYINSQGAAVELPYRWRIEEERL